MKNVTGLELEQNKSRGKGNDFHGSQQKIEQPVPRLPQLQHLSISAFSSCSTSGGSIDSRTEEDDDSNEVDDGLMLKV